MPPKPGKGKQVLGSSSSRRNIGRKHQMDSVMNIEKEDNFCQLPHFLKVFLPHRSSQRMKLPPGFGRSIPEGPIPKKLFLRSRQGKRFSVELGGSGECLFFEGEGWVQFVRDYNLLVVHFLVFHFDGANTFDFNIFEENGCEKTDEGEEEEDRAEEAEEEAEVKEEAEEEEEAQENERRKNIDIYGADIFRSGAHIQPVNPYFVTKVKLKRLQVVHIPHAVVKELESLKYELPEKLKVLDPRGRSFTLQRKVWRDGRICYGDGWRRLCQSNLVHEEDRVICEFIKTNKLEMQIRIIRPGN